MIEWNGMCRQWVRMSEEEEWIKGKKSKYFIHEHNSHLFVKSCQKIYAWFNTIFYKRNTQEIMEKAWNA